MKKNLIQNGDSQIPMNSVASRVVGGSAAQQATLLFVDDDTNILSALKRLFRPLGYRILTAENGTAGLETMKNEVVDLVVSDIRMPDMSGAQFMEKARTIWPDAIRILLTGYADLSATIDVVNKGQIYRYISKPWEDDDIVLSIKHALEQRQIEQKKSRNGDTSILIVEDSRTQAEQLSFLIEQHGYQVTVTANGKQALQAARTQKPALVISDIVMPEMDGYELCKAIKSDEKLRAIPVILVTTLSDAQDVIRGLECGADNFIRKPYDERYLLSRIDYLLMNLELRKNQKMHVGVEIKLGGQKYFINSERQQILDLLISTYEQAVHINNELKLRETELEHSNRALNGLYNIAAGLNHAITQCDVADAALERALELPEIQAGWIYLWEGDASFRLVATRNLPPALLREGVMDGLCDCRRRFLAGQLDHVTNIMECQRLKGDNGDTHGLRYHASVPLRAGDRNMGIMNLVGAKEGLFDEEELKMLYGVGNQVAVALERARLHEHLERLVEERTAALRQSESWFRAVFNSQQDAVFVTTPEGRIINANTATEKIFGYSVSELINQSMSLLQVDEQHYTEVAKRVQQSLTQDTVIHFEHELKKKNGEVFPSEHTFSPLKSEIGASEGIVRVIRDITLSKEHEARIARLNRIYSVLSGVNTTIVRVREEATLFNEACRIAVEHGGFIFAWVGKFDVDRQRVTPVAQAGRDDGYLAQINLTSREDTPGNCALTAQALTEARPVICNDIAADERMAALRSAALNRGYRSVVVLPLMLKDKPVCVFVLYAAETGVFDEEEMGLLNEIAGDISFALDHLQKEEKLNYLAYYDVITGLPNRALFYDRLGQCLHNCQSGETTAVLAIDLERFRIINETFGLHAGDALLKQVAERLTETRGGVDQLARIGADCFALVLSNIREGADVVRFLENQLATALAKPFRLEGQELRISVRAGIALFPGDGQDADTLFSNAEAALKKAKLSGVKYLFYTPEFNARVAEKLKLENKLRMALEQEQLVLHYQPKVDLKSNQIGGLEALIRWNDPETGLVPPWKFIPLLEETGMIIEAGAWALSQAMVDYRTWQARGLVPSRIAVNVSQVQLQRNDFVSTIERVVSDSGGAGNGLEIEITESLIMQDIETNIRKLHAIREMGVEVAIDDFGTGYSSLSYIAKLPINSLKIDRSFITNMTSNSDDLSIVAAIISLAHSLNLRVIAEGVETNEHAKLLRLLKCDEIQGFLFSPGVPAEQIEEFLREKKTLS